jgi:hypothetical protein
MHMIIFNNDKLPLTKFIKKGITYLNTCISPECKTGICNKIKSGRDNGYFLESSTETFNKECLVTGWELSHFMFHIFLGYFYNIYVSTGISVSYEVYERYTYNCASYNDLFINMAGFLVGNYLKKIL